MAETVKQAALIEDQTFEKNRDARFRRAQNFLDENYDRFSTLQGATWAENRVYFDALSKILFYVKDDRWTAVLEKIYWPLRQANFAKGADRETLMDLYMANRQYNQAADFRAKLPEWQSKDLPKPPKLVTKKIEAGEAVVLDIKDKSTLEATSFSLATYTGLVMVGSPNCHFTNNAAHDMLKAKKSLPSLAQYTVLLAPQESIDFNQVSQWNRSHSELPYRLVYREKMYKDLSFDSFPAFYFMKDGKIVEKQDGWPRGGNLAALRAGFKKIGL